MGWEEGPGLVRTRPSPAPPALDEEQEALRPESPWWHVPKVAQALGETQEELSREDTSPVKSLRTVTMYPSKQLGVKAWAGLYVTGFCSTRNWLNNVC